MRHPLSVLGTDSDVLNIPIGDRPETAENFHLRVAHHIRIERVGGLHCDQAEQLQHVILHHVAQGPGFFVVAGPGPDAFRFTHRDLHMIDVLVVPNRLEDAVGEPDDHEILNGFLPQIVIDAEDLRFVEHASRHTVDGLRGGQIAADRFLDDDAGIGGMQPPASSPIPLAQAPRTRKQTNWEDAQIENPVAG